jgi:Bacterial Ig domain
MTTVLLLAILASPPPQPAEPVALAYASSGEPSSLRQPGEEKKLAIPEVARLVAGATLQVPAGALLRIAFVDGRRFALQGPARAEITREGLRVLSGTSRTLDPVPPLPHLPAVRMEGVGPRIAAPRLRGDTITALSPSGGAMVPSDEVVLRFAPVRGATKYAVEVLDAGGKSVLAQTTDSTAFTLPAGSLEAGHSYSWSVETADASGTKVRGTGSFATLAPSDVAAHRRLREDIRSLDPELLQALDRELGLSASTPPRPVADVH